MKICYIWAMDEKIGYPMSYVSRSTGLSSHLIRKWEERYGAISPKRSEANQRVFSARDISRLKLLAAAVRGGHRISRIAGLDDAGIEELIQRGEVLPETPRGIEDLHRRCMKAIHSLDMGRLRELLNQATISFGLITVVEDLLTGLLREIGAMWAGKGLRIVHEHSASAVIRAYLEQALGNDTRQSHGKTIVAAAPAGQRHELGLLIASVLAKTQGMELIYLGADVPMEEIAYTALHFKADAVLLAIHFPGAFGGYEKEIASLSSRLPQETRIILGGKAAELSRDAYQKSVIVLEDMEELLRVLQEI